MAEESERTKELWKLPDALEREELGKVRPELDGHEIAEVLGIEPGPALGQAYKYLLSVRLDEGVIGKAEAAQRLREWWAERDATR